MRAQQIERLEGPDGLAAVEIDEPDPGGSVLIDVVAAGVSFPDLLLSRGRYQMKPPPPFVPGVEVSGTVRDAPADSGFTRGDPVMAFTVLGGFAEVVAADPAMTLPLPPGLGIEAAGGFLMNYHTAHFALARRAAVVRDEWVVVHGAAGGLGTAAVQVARGLGAHVAGVVSSDEKAAVADQAGSEVVLRSDGDWAAAVRELNGGRGADVILDPVGGDRFDASLRCLAPEGRLVVVGFTEGRIPSVQTNRLLLRNIAVVGAAWGALLATEPALLRETQRALDPMIAAGVVAPITGATFPLSDAGSALRLLEQRLAVGKVLLTMAR